MSDPAVTVTVEPRRDDDVRWLALTIREGLTVVVRAIEKRYAIDPVSSAERGRIRREAIAEFCARNGIRD